VAVDERTGVSLYFGQRDGNFSSATAVGDRSVVAYALGVGDLNHDGKVDIVVGHVEAPTTIYFNDGSVRHFSPVNAGDGKGTVYGFAIGDLDHDGFLDIGVARSEAPNVIYFGAPATPRIH